MRAVTQSRRPKASAARCSSTAVGCASPLEIWPFVTAGVQVSTASSNMVFTIQMYPESDFTNVELRMRGALSPHCSIAMQTSFVDACVFATQDAFIGTFRCPVGYPSFRDTGPIERHVVVFP